jgi:hypothetical protein
VAVFSFADLAGAYSTEAMLVGMATGDVLDVLASTYGGVTRMPGETDSALRKRVPFADRVRSVFEEGDMSKKDAHERAETVNEVLTRALEGGAFEAWRDGVLWRRAARDELRATARALVGTLADGLLMGLDVRGRDGYPVGEPLPPGDWDQARNAQLHAVYVVVPEARR